MSFTISEMEIGLEMKKVRQTSQFDVEHHFHVCVGDGTVSRKWI